MSHSAASISLFYHMMISPHHGLFTRVIAHSSPTGSMASYASALYGQKVVDGLCGHFQVSGEIMEKRHSLSAQQQRDLSVVQSLRSIPADALVNVPDVPGNLSCSRLTLDNTSLFPCHSFQMIRDPSRMDPGVTAVFLGTTLDECSGFVSQMGAGTVAGFQQALDRVIDPKLHGRLLALYGTPPRTRRRNASRPGTCAIRSSGPQNLQCCSRSSSNQHGRCTASTWRRGSSVWTSLG